MALPYRPPGVNISEIVGTTVVPELAAPTTVCIVGQASGYIDGREQLVFADADADNDPLTPNAPVAISLRGVPTDATLESVTEVRDAFSGAVYVAGTDFTVNTTNKTLTRLNTGDIDDGTVVRVNYRYLPADYFYARGYDSLQEVENRFGPAWSSDGLSIGSPLSHGVLMAMENGASFVYVQPLFVNSGSARVRPTAAQAGTVATWQSSLQALRDIEDINVVVPVIGQVENSDNTLDVSSNTMLSIFSAVQDHIWFMRTQDQFVMAILGEDSSNGVAVPPTTLINHAASLQARYDGDVSSHVVLLSPAKFIRGTAAANQTMYVGGQYAAAAVAGQLASRRVETPLTRKPVVGFLQVGDRRTKEEKNAEAAAGICVLEQRGQNVQVRHGLTVDNTNVADSEISCVRSKHFMVETLYNTFENQIVGEVVADEQAAEVVRSAVVATLERLRSLGVIDRYRNVDARLLDAAPTTVEVRFSYKPHFPINYIEIVFSIDTVEQTITNVTPGAGR